MAVLIADDCTQSWNSLSRYDAVVALTMRVISRAQQSLCPLVSQRCSTAIVVRKCSQEESNMHRRILLGRLGQALAGECHKLQRI